MSIDFVRAQLIVRTGEDLVVDHVHLFLLVGVEKTSLQPVFRDEFEVFLKSYGARETGERGR